MTTTRQDKIDTYLDAHAQGLEDCTRQLRAMAEGGISRLHTDSLPDGDRAFVEGKAWSRADVAPNDAAVEKLAQMVVADSARLDRAGWRADAGETRLFATMLKHIVARAVPTLYIPNKARMQFPVDNSIPAGARSVAFHRVFDHDDDDLGQISKRADDILEVSLGAEEILVKMTSYARAFSWALDELEEAAFGLVNLQMEGLSALNRAAERVFELIALQGDAAAGTYGMYNDAAITPTAVVTGTWSAATADQIYVDARTLIEAVWTASGKNYRPTRLVVPSESWTYMGEVRANTDRTVLEMLNGAYPGLQVLEASPRADLYDAAGTGPRMLAFTYAPDLARILESRRFALEAPERRGFNYRIPGRQKLGGAAVVVPLSMGYMDGI